MTPDEKRVVTISIIGLGTSLGLFFGLTVVGPKFFPAKKAVMEPVGDTPIVLVGGSMTFKAEENSGNTWTPVPNTTNQYAITFNNPIVSIALKQKAVPDSSGSVVDDSRLGSDLARLQVGAPTSWEIDEFISGSTSAVVSITPTLGASNSMTLALKGPGALCPETTSNIVKIDYSTSSTCPAQGTKPPAVTFSNVNLVVSNVVSGAAANQTETSLNCLDYNGVTGTCRIVFREH